LLCELVRNRRVGAVLVAAAAVQVAVTAAGLPGLGCPWRDVTGTPCPGCGLSRACAAMALGDWSLGMRLHPFAPVAVAVLATVGLGAVLPGRPRARLADALERAERRTMLGPVVGALLVAHAVARVAMGIDPDDLWGPPA
jgi:hypothetical protein